VFKTYLKRSFWVLAGAGALTGVIFGFGLDYLTKSLGTNPDVNQNLSVFADLVLGWLKVLFQANTQQWMILSIALGFTLIGVFVWGLLALAVSGILKGGQADGFERQDSTPGKKDFLDQKIEQERRQRLFLHTLSVLQREGRLLDFFAEDLSLYEDGQIGAAVRSIQEDCKKAIKKYIDLKPVLNGEEGELVTIEEGFDIDAVTLVGNVAGHPPFEGVIKHPGWKAGKKEVPRLSDIQDPCIMTPAEVEIR